MKSLIPRLLMFFGAILFLVGLSGIWVYVVQAVINRLGEPDQSLLFWYLPFLMFGFMGAGGGVMLYIFGWKKLKTKD
jgi:hypothetical protein